MKDFNSWKIISFLNNKMLPSFSFGAEGVEYGRNSAFYAPSSGAGGGVTRLLAGTNVTLSPPDGEGVVTVNASGGGGGGVTSLIAGNGVGVSAPSGDVTVSNTGVVSVTGSGDGIGVSALSPSGAVTLSNTGVTSLVPGPGIAVSSGTGAVTVSTSGFPVFTGLQTFTYVGNAIPLTYNVTSNAFRILFDDAGGTNTLFNSGSGLGFINNGRITLSNPAWNDNTIVMAMVGGPPSAPGGGLSQKYFGGIATCGGTGTLRVFTISGDSDVAPLLLNVFGLNGDKYVYFLVFQTAP